MHVSFDFPPVHTPTPVSVASQAGNGDSPLKGRACCNWQSSFLLLNLVALVAGVFFTYSIGFPILALALTALGVGEVILYHCSTKNDPDTPTFREYQALETAHTLAQQRMKEGLGKDEKAGFERDLATVREQLAATEGPLAELDGLRGRAGDVEEHARLTRELPEMREQEREAQAALEKRERDQEGLKREIQKSLREKKNLTVEIRAKKEELETSERVFDEKAKQARALDAQIAEKKRALSDD